MKAWHWGTLGVAVWCAGLTPAFADEAEQSWDTQVFDAPGAATAVSTYCGSGCGTYAYANNNFGFVTGFYTDDNVVPHGYIRTPWGHFIVFDAPGAGLDKNQNEGTAGIAINDAGVVGGQYEDASQVYHGFIRHPDNSFEKVDAPDAGSVANSGTFVFSINLEGASAGSYLDANYAEHGFVRTPSGWLTEFDPIGSVDTMVCEETCINDDGTVVGYFIDSSNTIHGFMRDRQGNITQIDAPGAGVGSETSFTGTIAASINPFGEITGYLIDGAGLAHGFVRRADGTYVKDFEAPGAGTGANQGTAALAINAVGAATGEYYDSNSVMHGFVRHADGTIGVFQAPLVGKLKGKLAAGQGTRPSTINLLGEVAGWVVDSTGLNHGFVHRDCE